MGKIAILGSGSWATALVKVFLKNSNQLGWWIHKEKTANFIALNGYNPTHLNTIKLPLDRLKIYTDLNKIIEDYNYFILAIPSIYTKEVLDKIKIPLHQKVFISSIKGIIPESSLSVIEHLREIHKISEENLGVIAGPCHAEEIALGKSSYLTIAFKEKKKADFISRALNCSYIQTHYLNDIEGITMASILKNIFAIASGITTGLSYGDNFQAVLVSNSIREMGNIIEKIYPLSTRNINNSAYLGDLLVTTYSKFSRNRNFGKMLGEGRKMKSILEEMEIAEGYYATKGIFEFYSKKVSMTIIETVYKILYKNISPKEAFEKLKHHLN